jgi:hypothetical protein
VRKMDARMADAFADPNKVLLAEARCDRPKDANGAVCGQRLASAWSTSAGPLIYLTAPSAIQSAEERSAKLAMIQPSLHGTPAWRTRAVDGFVVCVEFVDEMTESEAIGACPKCGPRRVDLANLIARSLR